MIKSTVPRRTQEITDNGTPVNRLANDNFATEFSAQEEWGSKSLTMDEKKAIVKVGATY